MVKGWLEKDLLKLNLIIWELLGGNHGMGYLVTHHSALPNGLFGEYQCLVSPKNVRYTVDGILKQSQYFNHVAQWQIFKNNCPSHTIIHVSMWKQFKQLVRDNDILETSQKILNLLQVLRWELENEKADPKSAAQVGKLINLDKLEDIKQNSPNEYNELITWLYQVKFRTQAGDYQVSHLLLSPNSLDKAECLLSAFAPKYHVLHDEYSSEGLDFFYACRRENLISKDITPEKLIDWIGQITDDQKEVVKQYILCLQHSLAIRLTNHFAWLKGKSTSIVEDDPNSSSIKDIEEELGEQDDSVVTEEDAKKYGEYGEKWAARLYEEKLTFKVENKNETINNPGFDLLCNKDKQQIHVEVKARDSEYPRIRLTKCEWKYMIDTKEKYELLICSHRGEKLMELIRVQNAWVTIQDCLSKAQEQKLSKYSYNSKLIEPLIGLQRNQQDGGNDILLDWHRLFRDFTHENIEKYKYNDTEDVFILKG
ncbi:protein NO VEIN domain-containing protein [Nodularia spumigena]|uniref:protein NO VEIN domain-containing protein n=1 Tax=Nodularia spumigena TaxID=70799 RepID=UPI002330A027|nr:DUF3883 domain-containing protein [Nodularia spumigena]MDB9317460.1 DUF3883 domain-containing protein [Nodularia spumigena CS-590/01A]MDB9327278.1 DUF3883 domain-containing protein [Nodularia spumigena CS-590/02]MDB9337325.1 DUF3883 domain-containing protein [Nodularia spumigena CS-590/01]